MLKKIIASFTHLAVLSLISFPFGLLNQNTVKAEEVPDYYLETFIISAYYSPLLEQTRYVTGSYEGDIYLNGGGVHGADGTPVYPGMIAAPKKYAFGTKMNIPGVGIVSVHDRGGAIVEKGVRGHEYDRLDIWMGYGDPGLERALNWGKRTVDVIVYGTNTDIQDSVYLEGYSAAEQFLQNTVLVPLNFPNDIYFGSEGEDVKKMQGYLKDWGYFEGEPSGFYGDETASAIYLFQLDNELVESADDLGAGHFGINTRRVFDKFITNGVDEQKIKLQKGSRLMKNYTDLNEVKTEFNSSIEIGEKGEAVTMLQNELNRLGYLRIPATGFYGEVTAHAVFKFQQSQGLVKTEEDNGAGYFGPATRSVMNSILASRFNTKSLLAFQREEIKNGRQLVKIPSKYYIAKQED